MIDARGERHGRLVVLEYAGSTPGSTLWKCRCDCGAERVVRLNNMRSGQTASCGCLRMEKLRASATRHGRHDTAEYRIWGAIKTRCFNKAYAAYPDYGGRGITMCDRWQRSFPAFLEDMGLRPSCRHSIDRIDNDGNYEPGNCRWATPSEQSSNQRPRGGGARARGLR